MCSSQPAGSTTPITPAASQKKPVRGYGQGQIQPICPDRWWVKSRNAGQSQTAIASERDSAGRNQPMLAGVIGQSMLGTSYHPGRKYKYYTIKR